MDRDGVALPTSNVEDSIRLLENKIRAMVAESVDETDIELLGKLQAKSFDMKSADPEVQKILEEFAIKNPEEPPSLSPSIPETCIDHDLHALELLAEDETLTEVEQGVAMEEAPLDIPPSPPKPPVPRNAAELYEALKALLADKPGN